MFDLKIGYGSAGNHQVCDRAASTYIVSFSSADFTGTSVPASKWLLSTAGREEPVFSDTAVQKIFESSGGIPRRINWLCEMALLVGFADGITTITENEIEAVAEELSVAA